MTQSEQILIDTAVRCGIREAMPDRDAILEAIREGAERALRPAAHPLIGRRVTRADWTDYGAVESVDAHMVAVVRFTDGRAAQSHTQALVAAYTAVR